MTKLLRSCDPVILGVLKCPGVELSLGVVGLAAEICAQICSWHLLRVEGIQATGWVWFLNPCIPLVPVTPGSVGTDVVSYTPLIL